MGRHRRLLKVTRGVSEVISTIMLNAIATGLDRLPAAPGRPAGTSTGSNNIEHQADPASRRSCPGFPLIPGGDRPASTASSSSRSLVGVALLVRCSAAPASASTCGPPAGPRPAAVASGVNVKRMVVIGDAALRRGRRPGRHAAAARRRPRLQRSTSRPGSASPASRSRCSAATTRRHRASARCSGRSWTRRRRSCDLDGRRQGDRDDHAGRHRAVASSSPTSWSAGTGSRAEQRRVGARARRASRAAAADRAEAPA